MNDGINEQEFESKWEADIAYGDRQLLSPTPQPPDLMQVPRNIMYLFLSIAGKWKWLQR